MVFPFIRALGLGMMMVACLLVVGCGGTKKDLYRQTDYFVEKLDTTYQSYGFPKFGERRFTQDRKYSVFPVGRMVNVRIEDYADSKEYEKLVKDLSRHYKGDRRVRQVYRNNGGTIMIDCRK